MYNLLRAMVERELSSQSGIRVGRVESTTDDGYSSINFRSQPDNALRVQSIDGQKVTPGDTGFFLQLGAGQAPMFWQQSSVSVGGADPTVIEA